MPFKCSVKGCRSNYDSTNEKVTVFKIPTADHSLRQAWISSLLLTSIKPSARVCIKHFNPDDIENQNKRNALKPGVVPTQSIQRRETNQWVEDQIEVQEIQQPEVIEDPIEGLDELCEGIDELQKSLLTDWNVFSNSEGICFYHLASKDDDFSDLTMSFKILINRNLKIRVFQNDLEASREELGDASLQSWSQLSDLLTKYQPEPSIEILRDPCMFLRKAHNALELVTNEELRQELDFIKIQIQNLYNQAENIVDDYLYQDVIEEEFIEEEVHLKEEVSGEGGDYLEEVPTLQSVSASQSRVDRATFQCQYCAVKLLSAKGLRSHEEKCTFLGTTSTATAQTDEESMMYDDHTELQECVEVDDLQSPSILSERKKRSYRYPCPECSRNFITKLQAAQHLLDKHDIEVKNVKNFCFECNAEFDDYINHVRLHSCNYTCNFCGSKFLTQSKLEIHRKSKHAGESESDRPFKCNEKDCGYFFKKVSHLKSHQLAHHLQMNPEEFKCNLCDKTFGRQLHLRVHSRLHFHSFACNFGDCSRVFKKLSSLKEHYMKEHGVSDIYMCNIDDCMERFQMLIQLKQHREDKHHREPVLVPKYYDGHHKTLKLKEEFDLT